MGDVFTIFPENDFARPSLLDITKTGSYAFRLDKPMSEEGMDQKRPS